MRKISIIGGGQAGLLLRCRNRLGTAGAVAESEFKHR